VSRRTSGFCVAVSLLLISDCACARRDQVRQHTLDAATIAIRRGELDAARELAQQGIALTQTQPESEWARRFVLLLGEVQIRRHDLPSADRLLKGPPDEEASAPLRARRQFLRGWAEMLGGNREMALDTLDRARELARAGGSSTNDRDLALDIDVVAGVLLLQLGRRDEGEARLGGVLQAAAASGDRYHQAVALLDLGYGQLVQKRYDAALAWFERVLALTDQSETTSYADALNNAGICYSRLGQFERAAAAQRRAVERHERGARREYEQALGQLGTTFRRWDRVRDGLPYLNRALGVATDAGLTADAALWAGNLADAYVDLGEWDRAEHFNDQSKTLKTAARSADLTYNTLRAANVALGRRRLDEASRLFTEALTNDRSDASVRWSAHEGLAQVAIAAGRPAVATEHFEVALRMIEKTRSELIRTDYKLSYLTRLIDFYRAYVDALVDQGRIDRALEVADSSRGRVLAERQGVTATGTSIGSAALRARAADSRTAFLSYWLAPARSYLWVVTGARVQMFTLAPAGEIEALVRQHQATIDNVLADPLKPGATAGHRLFELLVLPALPFLPRGSRILIVPDAALYALNFETLPVGSPQSPAASSHYLIEDFEVAVAPSLAMLDARGTATPAPAPSLLLIGNATPRDPEYPSLKFAEAEMANVARHFPAQHVTSFAGVHAVPAAYRDAEPAHFSHVHFTAHATANLDSPLDSAVILSGPDTGFKLYARDVAALPLHAELVTVSACRSAGGRTYSGEGLVGFAWAFLRGGARRVVAGLWDVDDKSTAELMDSLYDGLAGGEPAGKALRGAKLAILHRGGSTAKPYYWAPFELFTLAP